MDAFRKRVFDEAKAVDDEAAWRLARNEEVSIAEIHPHSLEGGDSFYRFTLPTGMDVEWSPKTGWRNMPDVIRHLADYLEVLSNQVFGRKD